MATHFDMHRPAIQSGSVIRSKEQPFRGFSRWPALRVATLHRPKLKLWRCWRRAVYSHNCRQRRSCNRRVNPLELLRHLRTNWTYTGRLKLDHLCSKRLRVQGLRDERIARRDRILDDIWWKWTRWDCLQQFQRDLWALWRLCAWPIRQLKHQTPKIRNQWHG